MIPQWNKRKEFNSLTMSIRMEHLERMGKLGSNPEDHLWSSSKLARLRRNRRGVPTRTCYPCPGSNSSSKYGPAFALPREGKTWNQDLNSTTVEGIPADLGNKATGSIHHLGIAPHLMYGFWTAPRSMARGPREGTEQVLFLCFLAILLSNPAFASVALSQSSSFYGGFRSLLPTPFCAGREALLPPDSGIFRGFPRTGLVGKGAQGPQTWAEKLQSLEPSTALPGEYPVRHSRYLHRLLRVEILLSAVPDSKAVGNREATPTTIYTGLCPPCNHQFVSSDEVCAVRQVPLRSLCSSHMICKEVRHRE